MSGPLGESKTEICRVCFASGNTKLRSLKNKFLINLYQKLSETKFDSEDARSRALCCFCYQKLLRCHTFSQMAHRSENILTQLFHKSLEATYENITEVNLGMVQHLSVSATSLVTVNTTKECSYVTCKDGPITVKEEATTEEDPLEVENSSQEYIKINNLKLEDSDKETDVEELPTQHVEESQLDVSFICKTCNQDFFHKNSFIQHVRKSHPLLKKKYSCNICYKKFIQSSDVEGHMRIHTGEKPFICDICNKTFRLKKFLVRHMQTHKEKSFACKVCDKHFSQKHTLVGHMITHTDEKPFACNICDKKFNKRPNLVRHKIIHTSEKPFACNACPKQFIQKSDVIRHMRVHASKPFSCDICRKDYSRKGNLVLHMATHTGRKLFSCQVCKKQFEKGNLNAHMRTHNAGENSFTYDVYRKKNRVKSTLGDDAKPFSCDSCEKKFNISSLLKIHQRAHTGEKPFACDICNKKFRIKGTLICHLRTHTGEKPFICNVCSKRFSDRSNLLKHKRIHTGEKPYACYVCDKKFNHQSDLARHKITHTIEKAFACNMCDKKFKQTASLNKHRKSTACRSA